MSGWYEKWNYKSNPEDCSPLVLWIGLNVIHKYERCNIPNFLIESQRRDYNLHTIEMEVCLMIEIVVFTAHRAGAPVCID